MIGKENQSKKTKVRDKTDRKEIHIPIMSEYREEGREADRQINRF